MDDWRQCMRAEGFVVELPEDVATLVEEDRVEQSAGEPREIHSPPTPPAADELEWVSMVWRPRDLVALQDRY